MIKLKCPNCSADIELDDTREIGFCSFCGTKILLKSQFVTNSIVSVENLLTRADEYLKNNDVTKAREFYNLVLDIDIKNARAKEAIEFLNQCVPFREREVSEAGVIEVDEVKAGQSQNSAFLDHLEKLEQESQKSKERAKKLYEDQLAGRVVYRIKEECERIARTNGVHKIEGYYNESNADGYGTTGEIKNCKKKSLPRHIYCYSIDKYMFSLTNPESLLHILDREIKKLGIDYYNIELFNVKETEEWDKSASLFRKISKETGQKGKGIYIKIEW